MAEIIPFKGIRYNKEKIRNIESVISPPYDVIDSKLQDDLYNRSEYNAVKIDKTKEVEGAPDKKYEIAAEYFNKWLEEKVLIQEEKEGLYIYQQDFEVEGEKKSRFGFIGLTKLEEFGKGILPHERTLHGPKVDRLKLTRATGAQFGLIFTLYPDPESSVDNILLKTINNEKPLYDGVDDEGIRHKLWFLSNEDEIKEIQRIMNNKKLFIADGHHRYETALNYSKENPDKESAKYVMMCFVNMQNPGLVVLPTHRLIKNLESFNLEEFKAKLENLFFIKPIEKGDDLVSEMIKVLKDEGKKGKHAFGMYSNGEYYIITLKDESVMDKIKDHSEVWKKLDVTILHTIILEDLLGIDAEKLVKESNVEYLKDTGSAIKEAIIRIDKSEFQIGFFMNATKTSEVEKIAENNEKMPQKSTFYFPKIYTGLVINKY